ncbi:DUF2849 domain-containing protein [Parvularcula marina]|uniref:DUF2849 domain-containing protein n=1 Tax=Parvularcula marina TaxID=2292771 RepID=UPI0035131466
MSATALLKDTPAPAKISAGGVKKTRNVGLKTVTANDLMSGAAVYLTKDGAWTEDLADAIVAEGERALGLLSLAETDEARIVGPYLMDVEAEDAGTAPSGRATLRETIRRAGPTIHPEFARGV